MNKKAVGNDASYKLRMHKDSHKTVNNNEEYVHTFELIVVGGGLAGVCCAIAAARKGLKTCIIQDRPVFGGNSSSEIRVVPSGSIDFHSWSMETGILAELLLEDRAANHESFSDGAINGIYDLCLYDALKREPNITIYLNTTVRQVTTSDCLDNCGGPAKMINNIYAFQLGSGLELKFAAKQYADCTGDGVLAYLSGADFMYGRDSRTKFNEQLAPESTDNVVMGSSINFHARNIGKPVPFSPPSWTVKFDTGKGLGKGREINCLRQDKLSGYWWMEIGNPFHTVKDAGMIRDELLAYVLGVWDYAKNIDPLYKERLKNFAIDWIGALPGKRESRRVYGDVVVTENDLQQSTCWPDSVCNSGCYIDIHINGGILNSEEPAELSFIDRYYKNYTMVPMHTLPLRAMYSRDIANLWMAGRHMSLSRVAMAADRLQCVLANAGQAVGTAAAVAVKNNLMPGQLADPLEIHIKTLQQQLLKDDLYILGLQNKDETDLAIKASARASSEQPLDFKGTDKERYETLDTIWGQVFPVTSGRIDRLEFYLKNMSEKTEKVWVALYEIENIWDKSAGKLAAATEIKVKAGYCGWVHSELNTATIPGKPYRLVLRASEYVAWHRSCFQPAGTLAQYFSEGSGGCEEKNRHLPSFNPSQLKLPAFQKWNEKRSDRFSFSLRISPLQWPYGAENVVNGYSRPYVMPNMWISDEKEGLPCFIELEFESKVAINCLQVTFDTNLNVQYSKMPGFWKAEECVKDWNITVLIDDEWQKVYEEKGNYKRLRVARFNSICTGKVRVNILSTNGDECARIYEIRAYTLL